MTRRSRRASSVPQRVGSDKDLTSSRPRAAEATDLDALGAADEEEPPAETGDPEKAADAEKAGDAEKASTRHTRSKVDQTKDDTDEGWGECGDDDASARWLRENRPPHWD